MKRLKLKDKYYKLIDGFEVNESSREVKYSNVKIDFTGKGIEDLPLKYQQCQLVDADVVEKQASEGETIEGTSLSIDYDKDREFEYNLKGQTSQSGTPTPSSPQPINITTGRQVVSVCKTNKVGVQDGTYTLGNLTFSITNGVIEFNGTTDTATRVFYIPLVNPVYLKNGETNTFYVKTEGTTNNQVAMRLLTTNVANDDNSFARTYFTARTNNTNSRAYTQVKDQTFTYLLIQFNANQTINFKSYIQLNGGSSVLDYEEYKGNDYEINLGKNLWGGFTFNRTINGIDFVANENGTITANGTATGQAINISTQNISANSWYKTLEAGTYTLSVEIDGTYTDGSSSTRVQLLNMSGTILTYATPTQNGTLTITQPTQIWVRASIYSGGTAQNITFKPQLEKGDATSYSPYKTPIYLGKIGTYQDYIFKNTTENPLYDSNLEEGQWYIHKEIGRVVLNGTQANPTLNTSSTNTTRIWYNYDLLEHNAKVRLEGLCNRLTIQNNWSQDIEGFRLVEETKQLILRINKSTVGTTVSSVNTWLSNNNVIVYYIFETPTNTLIEDEELINQLNSIKLISGINNISIISNDLPFLMNLHYNFNEDLEIITEREVIYTGYVNNYTLPKMKNKLEYRELDIDLLSPLALATLRTADAVGSYNLQDLVKEIIQPLIDDGFTLKELNVGNNQVSVNYLTETIESALNKLSNKFNFWWYIDKNKNIYINDINYIFNRNPKAIYDNNNKINGLIDFTPKMESIDYCNTLDFTNVRLITKSSYIKEYNYQTGYGGSFITHYYNPIFNLDTISSGDEIEFDIPFIINNSKKGNSQTMVENDSSYFKLDKITTGSGGSYNYTTLVNLTYDENNQVILPNNVAIADSYNDDKEFVFVRDSFFKNLIVGMKYNGSSQINVGKVYSETALMWAKIRISDNDEISTKKNVISDTGIIEKQVDMNEQWLLYEELIDISNSLIRKDTVNVELVELKTDIENDFNVGDIIDIDKSGFLTYGRFIITDKKRSYYDNVDSWIFNIRNTNILESYVDLFRSSDEEEQSDRVFNLVSSDYIVEGIKEGYEVEVG